jgi:hypothetical protein
MKRRIKRSRPTFFLPTINAQETTEGKRREEREVPDEGRVEEEET